MVFFHIPVNGDLLEWRNSSLSLLMFFLPHSHSQQVGAVGKRSSSDQYSHLLQKSNQQENILFSQAGEETH